MNENFDFIERLVDELNRLNVFTAPAKAGFITTRECLRVYPLPGGKEITTWMDGSKEMELPFEVAIKTKNNALANSTLWEVYQSLENDGLEIPSLNGSYEFEELKLSTPSLNDVDKEGWYIYLLDLTATLIIKNKQED